MPIYSSSIGPVPHPIPIGGLPELSSAFPVAVYIKRYWTDAWALDANIIPQRVTFSTAESQLGSATFIYRYGERVGEDSLTPIDYNRWLIKVEFGSEVWIGQIQAQTKELHGADSGAPAGTTIISALSMESIFHHTFITKSAYLDFDASSSPSPEVAQQGLTFNEGGRPNRYTSGSQGYFCREESAGFWSTRDIILYALNQWVPTAADGGIGAPVTITPIDLAKLPNWDQPQLETHGYRPIEVINRLITRRRLLVWWFEYRESDNMIWQNTDDAIWQNSDLWGTRDSLIMRIATLNQNDFQVAGNSGGVIPGNPQQFLLNADNDHTAQVVVEQDSNSLIDQVVVQGGKMRSIFSLKFNDESTYSGHIKGEKDWSDELEEEYEEAGSGEANYPAGRGKRRAWHEIWRGRPKYRDVFAKFRIDASEQIPTQDLYKVSPFSVRLLPVLPILQDGDYSDDRIASGEEQYNDSTRDDFMQPIAFFRIKPKHNDESEVPEVTWVDASKLGQNSDVTNTDKKHDHDFSCDFRTTGDDASFRLEVSRASQHIIATKEGLTGAGNFDPRDEDIARGELTWREMVATVAVEHDRYCSYTWPFDQFLSGDDPKRVLLIDAGPDYRLDWVAADTAFDVDHNSGDLITSTGGFYRDDRAKLAQIAIRAAEYYTTIRNIMRLRCAYQEPVTLNASGNVVTNSPFRLGSYLIGVQHGPIASLVLNSVVTQYSVDFPVYESSRPIPRVGPPTIEVTTAFGEVSPSFFVPSKV